MIKLLGYKVDEATFNVNNEETFKSGENFKINPKIRIDIKKNEKNMAMVFTVTIDRNQPTPTPFELKVKVIGSFDCDGENDINTLRKDGSNLLYPFVRSTVASFTQAMNMPSYFLPILDFNVPMELKENKPSHDSQIIRPLEDF